MRLEHVSPPRDGDRLRFVLARRTASSTVVRPPPGVLVKAYGDDSTVAARGDVGHPWSLPVEGQAGSHFSRLVRLPPGRYSRMLADEIEALQAFRIACLSSGDTELLPSIAAAVKLLEQSQTDRGEEMEEVFGELELPEATAAAAEGFELDDWEREECDDADTAEGSGQRPDTGASSSARPSPIPSSPTPAGGARGSPGPWAGLGPSAGSTVSTSPSMGPGTPGPSGRSSGGGDAGPVPQGAGPRNHLVSFYQAEDGRPVFLQPIFTRFLLHEFGDWENLPVELPTVRIERVHAVTICEEIRRKNRFLSHLPLGSQISFAEVDLRSVLSRETKEHFAMDFEKIRDLRKKEQQKSRKEDRLSKSRFEAEEDKYYTSLNRQHPRDYVPQVVPKMEDFVPLPGSRAALAAEANQDGEAHPSADEAEEEPQGPTLAMQIKEKMAARGRGRAGKGRGRPSQAAAPPPLDAESWGPALGAAGSGGGSAWGRGRGGKQAAGRKGSSEAAAQSSNAVDEAPAPEGPPREVPASWESEDEAQPTLGQALDLALRSATTGSPKASGSAADASQPPEAQEDAEANVGSGTAQGKKKKGKAKPKTIRLFG